MKNEVRGERFVQKEHTIKNSVNNIYNRNNSIGWVTEYLYSLI